MDTLTIRNLELWTHIGMSEEERKCEQCLLIDMTMEVQFKNTSKSDSISIDYAHIAENLYALGKKERKTIEKLAEDLAEMILSKYGTASVTVIVHKRILPGTKGTSLSITRP